MGTITWSLAIITGNNKINNNKSIYQMLVISIATGMLQCNVGAHHPMDHTPGFPRSHWMPQLGECLHCIAAVATMVENFGQKHKTLTKNYFS